MRFETFAALTAELPRRMRDGVATWMRAFDDSCARVLSLRVQNRRVGDFGASRDAGATFACKEGDRME